jgi:Ubiquinol-cytochrome-c reductase complex subunit (QCR10)
MAASFGAAALIALLFLGEEIPTVNRDIFQKIPIIGGYWEKTVPPEDNPF